MAEKIGQDQAPQHQDNNSPEDPSVNQGRLEHSPAQVPQRWGNTPLADAIDTYHTDKETRRVIIPNHIPEGFSDKPKDAAARELPRKGLSKLAKRGIAGVGIAAGVAGAIYGIHTENKNFDAGDRAEAGTSLTEKGPDTVPTLSPEAVDAKARFDADIENANDSVRHGLEIHGLGYGNFFPKDADAGPASRDMTPAAILARNNAEQQWVRTNPDRQQALKDASLIAPSDTAPYRSMRDIVNSDNPADHDSTDVVIPIGTPYHFNTGVHDGVTANGDTWMIGTTSVQRGENTVAVFEWHQDPSNPNSGEWQHMESFLETEPSFSSTFADVLQK